MVGAGAVPGRRRGRHWSIRAAACLRCRRRARCSAYLHAGHLFVSATPCRVSTILGSCVAVALFDPVAQDRRAQPLLLPQGPRTTRRRRASATSRCRGSSRRWSPPARSRRQLQAKLFGGACVLRAFRTARPATSGRRTCRWPAAILLAEGIPVVAEDVDGERGRKLIFQTHDGSAWVRSL